MNVILVQGRGSHVTMVVSDRPRHPGPMQYHGPLTEGRAQEKHHRNRLRRRFKQCQTVGGECFSVIQGTMVCPSFVGLARASTASGSVRTTFISDEKLVCDCKKLSTALLIRVSLCWLLVGLPRFLSSCLPFLSVWLHPLIGVEVFPWTAM